jgi:hypothetical protein
MRDLRLPELYVAIPLGLLLLGFARRAPLAEFPPARRRFLWFLLVALGVAYALWLTLFSIQRYAMALEMMAPLACMLVIAALPWRRLRPWLGGIVLASMLALFAVPNWGRGDWATYGGHYIGVTLPQMGFAPGDLVLFGLGPYDYIGPSLPPGTRFASFSADYAPGSPLSKFAPRLACLLAAQRGAIFIVIETPHGPAARVDLTPDPAAYGLRLVAGDCRPVRSSLHHEGEISICPLRRVAAPASSSRSAAACAAASSGVPPGANSGIDR